MKKYNLRVWNKPESNYGPAEVRVYINGTNRDHNKLFIRENDKECAGSHSANIDGTAKYIGGNIYKKRDKDSDAIWDALHSFNITPRTPFCEIIDAINNKTLAQFIPSDEK